MGAFAAARLLLVALPPLVLGQTTGEPGQRGRLLEAAVPGASKCLIGRRGELRFPVNVSDSSICCAAAEVLLARRQRGYCPESEALHSLPFKVRCGVDSGIGGAYAPDRRSAGLAARALCGMPECMTAVTDVVERANRQGVALVAPRCDHLDDMFQDVKLPPLHTVLAASVALCAIISVLVIHCMFAPWWVRKRVAAFVRDMADRKDILSSVAPSTSSTHAQAADINLHFEELDVRAMPPPEPLPIEAPPPPTSPHPTAKPHVSVEPLPPSPAGPPPPTPIGAIAVFGDEGIIIPPTPTTSTGKAVVDEPFAALEEDVAFADLSRARASCRAHLGFLCVLGTTALLARIVISLLLATGTLLAAQVVPVMLGLGAWQLGVLIQVVRSPVLFSGGMPDGVCGTLISDLRMFAGSALAHELLVLCVAMSIHEASTAPGEVDDRGVVAGPEPLSRFVIKQVSLSLVLIRLYTAWLAHNLQRLRVELTFTVLPECAKDAAKARHALERQRALDMLLPSWGLSANETVDTAAVGSASANEHAAVRRRAQRRLMLAACMVLLLVLATAAVGIWRVQVTRGIAARSSCRTAMRGVAFCVPTDYIGLYEHHATYEDCCASCDASEGCDAWSFAESKGATGGRCWRMRFVEEPCSQIPGHPDCLCHTTAGRMGGFRPRVDPT
eukprot:gnl/TRDRNA2_/TRDRNA2_188957_c0_seq1.p1 gnl/TRDRNA2_/TRDRNA2_188957_c0~~gnl/TRDRNA2_/TRDRNA2_188957_c0_seq1.p1  ORF type:complete len:688 (+),score=91.04 gnl/TRDRNA2_/TRDRNA2_188957_c0_seq1:50-2065(+)